VAENAKVDFHDAVGRRVKYGCDAARGIEFRDVPLSIVERKRAAVETVASGEGEAGRGVESAAEKTDGFLVQFGHSHSMPGL